MKGLYNIGAWTEYYKTYFGIIYYKFWSKPLQTKEGYSKMRHKLLKNRLYDKEANTYHETSFMQFTYTFGVALNLLLGLLQIVT